MLLEEPQAILFPESEGLEVGVEEVLSLLRIQIALRLLLSDRLGVVVLLSV